MLKNDQNKKISEEFTSELEKISKLDTLNTELLPKINSLFKKFFGFSSNFINSISIEDLNKIIKNDRVSDSTKVTILACLLKEEGLIYEKTGDYTQAFHRYVKSFTLFSDVILNDETSTFSDFPSHLNISLTKLLQYNLNLDLKDRVFRYYEKTNQFGKAEDILYEILEVNPAFNTEAISFYKRLLKKTDEQLILGNLPREEIIDGLSNLEN